ncbi:GntR family transcriptional regulator [Cytobacillus firmus]|uniref:GntR family transcriptional regulator n=1 Tax=Cytobacillus firmus TaxID=1399 RepID=UPI001C8EA30D|nr:GntR family transcriptional regulator [Cytobacillus firmus]MBX9976219.1 GntR family transcriptional regulator [Cytobacillus firmus]
MSEKMMLVDELITQIKKGKYKPNEKLPSENELADQYRIPRMVVRKAYEQLQDLGFIFSKQGRGSYVQNRKQQIPLILTGDISFSEKMKELEYDFRSENICCEKIRFDSEVFHALKVNPQDEVYKISRLRIVDGCPIALHTSYAAKSVFPQIDRDGPGIKSIFHYYRTHGYKEFTSGQSQLSVVFPIKHERGILQCSSLIPLLLLESLCMDKETGTVLEFSRIKYRSDCFTYLI